MKLPIVALVGAPNSGKSSLLNKIAGQQAALASNVPGTTRDRQYFDVAWNGMTFTLVDTAGLDFSAKGGSASGGEKGELEENVKKQIDVAKDEADLLILLVDGKLPMESIDREVLMYFRRTKKPVLLCVNKIDSPKKIEPAKLEYKKFGIKSINPTSASTGLGVGDLLDEVVNKLKEAGHKAQELSEPKGIKISIVGKPNVGKSTIYNAILGQERAVVSSVPGTTRAPIDTYAKINDRDIVFIDTAGLKKTMQKSSQPDFLSSIKTFMSIKRSDVVFFVIDATDGITKQDQSIASRAYEDRKGIVILVNKSETLDEDDKRSLKDMVTSHFPFLWMCPIFFVSGKENIGLTDPVSAAISIYDRRSKTVSQEDLTALLKKTLKENPPRKLWDQKDPKVQKLTQVDTHPPVFELSVNSSPAISENYRKYLANTIIKELDFWGTPIVLRLFDRVKAHTSMR